MKKIAVLTGAGISAESGLKTFRDSDGLWEGYEVEDVATINAWRKNPALVLEFYNWRREDALKAQPNWAHKFLAEAEKKYEITIITQNVDDLHERAGSSQVMHLHGELTKMRSVKNDSKTYPWNSKLSLGDVAPDGGQLRPHIVWFGENVPMIDLAADVVNGADALLIIGTSLVVYPAAGLIHMARPATPIFLLDKHIPDMKIPSVHTVEKSATEGIEIIFSMIDEEFR